MQIHKPDAWDFDDGTAHLLFVFSREADIYCKTSESNLLRFWWPTAIKQWRTAKVQCGVMTWLLSNALRNQNGPNCVLTPGTNVLCILPTANTTIFCFGYFPLQSTFYCYIWCRVYLLYIEWMVNTYMKNGVFFFFKPFSFILKSTLLFFQLWFCVNE